MSIFDKLHKAAIKLNDNIIMELEVWFQDFIDKMSGVDLSQRLRQSLTSQSSSANVPATSQPPVFKPIESFWRIAQNRIRGFESMRPVSKQKMLRQSKTIL